MSIHSSVSMYTLNSKISTSTYLGLTSLMTAALYGNTETEKILLEHRADVNTKNQEGKLHTITSIMKYP